MHDGDRGTEKSARSHDTAVETRPADPTASAFGGGLRFYKKRSWGDRVVLEMGRNPNQTSTNRTRTRVLPTTEPNPNREVKKTRKNRILPEPYVYTTRTEHEPNFFKKLLGTRTEPNHYQSKYSNRTRTHNFVFFLITGLHSRETANGMPLLRNCAVMEWSALLNGTENELKLSRTN